MFIPKEIHEDEILVRFIFLDNFKNKRLEASKINTGEIFLDTRLVGVSLQRSHFSTENFCKQRAKEIESKSYVGFVLFYKSSFSKVVVEYQIERPYFKSYLKFTPLDENQLYLIDQSKSKELDSGNPSHTDLIYINPAMLLDEDKPNTSLRLFSRKLFSNCKLVIDEELYCDTFTQGKFSDIISER